PVLLLVAFFFVGIVNRTKSILGGRQGPGMLQHVRDVMRLYRKGAVISTTTSLIFRIAPTISFVTVVLACCLLPIGASKSVFAFPYDVVAFAYLLALGRFVMILAALDTGSPFEGMGANREAIYGMLVEPAFFVLLGSFAVLTGNTSFSALFATLHLGTDGVSILMSAFAVYVILQIAMVENSRLPVDDPRTHLELTMVHEVMILDHSGFDLALIMTTSSLKFAVFGLLLANFHLPPDVPLAVTIGIVLAVCVLFAVTVGALESFRARNRMKANPQFILTLTSIAVLVYFSVLILTNNLVL
ncbi:MAG: NADH-quinone oxidoreductase subunit H, partial [Candidatus Kapabacteria bacterium]|nr:NADH-quinone oxidoreductase subunit H [Candidatus Kapabacteria bacterium]